MSDHQWTIVARLADFWARRATRQRRDAAAMYYHALAICAYLALLHDWRGVASWTGLLRITV